MLDNKHSDISLLLEAHMPGLAAWRSAYRGRLPAEVALRPVWDDAVGPVPFSTLGMAIDARLRLALTPDSAADCFETGPSRRTIDALIADGRPPSGPGSIQDIGNMVSADFVLGLPPTSPALSAGRRRVGAALLVRDVQPWSGSGLAVEPEVEDRLCSMVFVAAWLEECYRTGRTFPGSALEMAIAECAAMSDTSWDPAAGIDGDLVAATAQRLLDLVPQPAPADLRSMLGVAERHGHWAQLRASGRIELGPVFAGSGLVGGADADVLADGLLIDIKATVDPRRARPQDLHQLLGYALLDFDDRYGIDAVGLFLARQGRLISWPLDEVLALVGSSHAALAGLRQELHEKLRTARAHKDSGGES